MRFNTIPSAVVSASANTVGGVPVCREDDAAKADVVAVKLRQPLSPAETDLIFIQWNLNVILVGIGNSQQRQRKKGELSTF